MELDKDALPRGVALQYDLGEIVYSAAKPPELRRFAFSGLGLRVDGSGRFAKSPAFLADPRFRQARPFEHGRFGRVGPSYRYSVSRFDRVGHRFWLGGAGFLVASFDWPLAVDWCWDCGDDFVVYDDPDHPGWYLLYNTQTGAYIHAQYGG